MKISLITVGKTDIKWVREGLDLYSSRLLHYVNFELHEIPELKNAAALSKEQIKSKEGENIKKLLKPSDEVILLDEHGREYSSTEFSGLLQRKLTSGRDLCFIIGGAYGFSQEIHASASSELSLSRMTFSHQMVRTIFAEQLYRAFTIIKGEPYHHE